MDVNAVHAHIQMQTFPIASPIADIIRIHKWRYERNAAWQSFSKCSFVFFLRFVAVFIC